MANDYAAMRTRILDEFVNESLTTAQVNNAIQTAIKHYERRPFYFNQKTGTFPTVAAQEYYSSTDLSDIPSIVSIVAATVTNSTKSKLEPVDFSIMDDTQDGSITGPPEMLAVFKQQIRLYPIPDGIYTITMAYIYRFTALSADGDTNAWMVEGEELIRQKAKRILALDILQADDLATRAASLEAEALDEILAEGRRRLPNTVLRPSPMISLGNTFNFTRGW